MPTHGDEYLLLFNYLENDKFEQLRINSTQCSESCKDCRWVSSED